MPRLNMVHESIARGLTAKLFQKILRATGKLINMFRAMGNSPAGLAAYLQMSESLKTGVLNSDDRRIIALVVSDELSCQYWLDTHRTLAKSRGMTDAELDMLLEGRSDNHKAAALARFVRAVIHTAGNIPDTRLTSIRNHGYGDDHITEIIGAIAMNTYASYFNTLNRTEFDFNTELRIRHYEEDVPPYSNSA